MISLINHSQETIRLKHEKIASKKKLVTKYIPGEKYGYLPLREDINNPYWLHGLVLKAKTEDCLINCETGQLFYNIAVFKIK